MSLTAQIEALEARLPDVKASRKAHGIPQLDGCPESWLQRYLEALQVPQETDLDAWWHEQTGRQPNPYQVWRMHRTRAVRLIASFQTKEAAIGCALKDRPAIVFKGFDVVLRVRADAGFRRLKKAVDGTPLAKLRMSAERARELCAELGGVALVKEGRSFVLRWSERPPEPAVEPVLFGEAG